MPTSSETIYSALPIPLQNLACSVHGWRLFHRRYGGDLAQRLRILSQRETASADELRRYQDVRLRELIAFAASRVPFYREAFARNGVDPERFSGSADLSRLPIVDKQQIREAWSEFQAPTGATGPRVVLKTSGTTGTPLRVSMEIEARRKNYAFFLRSRRWAGIEGFPPAATFGGRLVVPHDQQSPPFWRTDWRPNTLIFSSYHLSKQNVPAYIDRLRRLEPRLIDSYPSSLASLATLADELGLPAPRVAGIITSSETLHDAMRERIEAYFGCRVFDQYGSTEQVAFVAQCEAGSYHVFPDFGFVELLDENGAPARPGEPAEVVATGFTNRAMPLIRYRLGDLATWTDEPCRCGRAFPVIGRILGRQDDMLTTPDGKLVGRLDPVFKDIDGIREAQIAQTAPDRVEVRIVPDPAYDETTDAAITAALRERIGSAMHVEVVRVDALPRDRSGKLRLVIRESGARES